MATEVSVHGVTKTNESILQPLSLFQHTSTYCGSPNRSEGVRIQIYDDGKEMTLNINKVFSIVLTNSD